MAVKVKAKNNVEPEAQPTTSQIINPLKIPVIIPPKTPTPNIIIRAIKIMLMDIRMRIHPQTKEELEAYSRFSDLVYGRR